MSALLFIVKNNMKKRKGDVITLFVLTLIATFMLYSSVSIMSGISRVQDKYHDKNNDCDMYFWTDDKYIDEMSEIIASYEHVEQFESTRTVNSDIAYRSSGESDWHDFAFYFGAYEEPRSINKLDHSTNGLTDKDILLPYNLSTSFKTGDSIFFKIDEDEYEFNVAGFVTDAFFSSTINFSSYNVYISDSVLDEFVGKYPEFLRDGRSVKVIYDDPAKTSEYTEEIEDMFKTWVSGDSSRLDASWVCIHWEEMKAGNAIFANLVTGVILVFAILILFIAMIVINFSIRNFIEKNMKNTGMLMANGYTTCQLMAVTTIENLIVSLTASVIGIIIGVAATSIIGKVVAIVLGMPWKEPINVASAALAVGVTVLLISGISLLTSFGYKKTVVLDALRGGVHSHNFKKNYLPLEHASFSLPISLSLKDILGDKRRNIILFLIVVILTMSTNVAFSLSENFRDRDLLLDISGNETATACVEGSRDDLRQISMWDDVDYATGSYNFSVRATSADHSEGNLAAFVWTDPSKLEHEMIVEGRVPENDHEIVLGGLVADKFHLGTGDVIYLEWGQKRADYVVVGIDQKVMNYGNNMMLSDEGAKRLIGEVDTLGIYVYGKDGVVFDDLHDRLRDLTGDNPVDVDQYADTLMRDISNGILIICIAVTAVTVLVVIFVEHLLIKSKIIKNWKNYGINKALGFTSGQLRVQTMFSNIPTVLMACLVGSTISGPMTSKLTTLIFRSFGFRKMPMDVYPQWIIVTLFGIVIIAMITSLAVSRSIKKLQPVELLTEE